MERKVGALSIALVLAGMARVGDGPLKVEPEEVRLAGAEASAQVGVTGRDDRGRPVRRGRADVAGRPRWRGDGLGI